MPLPKLPKANLASKPILVTKEQHRKIHSVAKRKKLRVTEVIDIMIEELEKVVVFDAYR